jgi:hypothetical protein
MSGIGCGWCSALYKLSYTAFSLQNGRAASIALDINLSLPCCVMQSLAFIGIDLSSHNTFTTLHTIHPPHSIPDINQSLIDDNLVCKEKIGGSNYFWSFPSKKDRQAQLAHESTLASIESLQSIIKDASVKLENAKRGREEDDSGERAKKMARRDELSKAKTAAENELSKLKENDPQAIADLEMELKLVTAAANRWTDNIFSCRDWLVKKRGMGRKEAEKLLQITDAFDCE